MRVSFQLRDAVQTDANRWRLFLAELSRMNGRSANWPRCGAGQSSRTLFRYLTRSWPTDAAERMVGHMGMMPTDDRAGVQEDQTLRRP